VKDAHSYCLRGRVRKRGRKQQNVIIEAEGQDILGMWTAKQALGRTTEHNRTLRSKGRITQKRTTEYLEEDDTILLRGHQNFWT
jgi:hypothetical protein